MYLVLGQNTIYTSQVLCYTVVMTEEEIKSAKKKYWAHQSNAVRRKIAWEFTFETWIELWIQSGHWYRRGIRNGQYVMSRKGDAGPYSPSNVFIQSTEYNVRDGSLAIPKKEITKQRMSVASISKSKPKLQCQYCSRMISVSNMNKHQSIHS